MEATTTAYPGTTRIDLNKFSCQPDEGGFVIGFIETGDFIAVPKEAVQILQWFGKGHSLDEVAELCREKHHRKA